MISGTLSGHTALTKQKKYPKVRRREPLKEGDKNQHAEVNDCSTFGYSSLNNQEDDLWDENIEPVYSADQGKQRKFSANFTNKNKQELDSKPSGANYIEKLIHETEDLKLKEAENEKTKKLSNDGQSQKVRLENNINLEDDKNSRTLMKEKPKYLLVENHEARSRSKSDVDVSSSFLAGALKDSLFAAQFTVPTAEGQSMTALLNSKVNDTTLRRGSFGATIKEPKTSRKLSLDHKARGKDKDHLLKGLQNTIFQPSLLAPKKPEMTNSCPNLVEQTHKKDQSSSPGVLRKALLSSHFAIDIPRQGNVVEKQDGEKEGMESSNASEWQKVETIEKVNVELQKPSPAFPDVLCEALMNTWLALNISSPSFSTCTSRTVIQDDSVINYNTCVAEDENRKATSSNVNSEMNSVACSQEPLLNLQNDNPRNDQASCLPAFVINEPEGNTPLCDHAKEEMASQTSDFEADEFYLKYENMEAGNSDPFLSISSTSPESTSQASSSHSKGGIISDEDRNKSIKDVLNILSSIQGEQEYGFFEDRCCAAGPGLTEGFVDEPSTFHLVLMDKPDLGNLQVIIESPGILQPKTEYVPLTKNIIRVVYWPERVGRYSIRILWKNREIPGSPFHPLVLLPKCEVWIKRVL